MRKTGTPEDAPFKLHSFGYRGASSEESAGIGGAAELLTSMGTDTVAGILTAQEYYNTENMLGFSINAAEHSTITAWGKEFEKDAYENMLNQFLKPGGIVAVVSDSYDLSNAILNIWGKTLKQKIVNSEGVLVIRPDSGEPSEVVLRSLEQLGSCFGYTLNCKGFKILPKYIRLIQGDGLNCAQDIEKILVTITEAGWSADNLAFGMGGGSIQQINRDTYKYAMKMSAILVDGVWRDVYKQPADCPWKVSKKGRFDYLNLPLVWKNGKFFREYSFEEVRANAMQELVF